MNLDKITNSMQINVEKYVNETLNNNIINMKKKEDYRFDSYFYQSIIKELKEQYDLNKLSFKNPFYYNMKKSYFLNISSYTSADELDILAREYQKDFEQYNDIENTTLAVSIVPVEYLKSSNHMIKYVHGCRLDIELIEKMEKNKIKGK